MNTKEKMMPMYESEIASIKREATFSCYHKTRNVTSKVPVDNVTLGFLLLKGNGRRLPAGAADCSANCPHRNEGPSQLTLRKAFQKENPRWKKDAPWEVLRKGVASAQKKMRSALDYRNVKKLQ